MLKIKNLSVAVEKNEILRNLNLEVKPGEVHVVMGPNGAGKSTLANTLAGHPKYEIKGGEISIDDEKISDLSPDQRAKKGLFLSMQYIPEIPGVSIANFLRIAYDSINGTKSHPVKFHKALKEKASNLSVGSDFLKRHIGVGFSGGEKKRLEVLQLKVLDPKYAILDETDSGLDVDALKIVGEGIEAFRSEEKGILLITHYNRLLEYIKPDFVHIMNEGKIVHSGGAELAKEIEEKGYSDFVK